MPRDIAPNRVIDARVQVKDFPGLATNADPHDIPSGAAVVQKNCMSLRPGELRVRPGCRVVAFECSC